MQGDDIYKGLVKVPNPRASKPSDLGLGFAFNLYIIYIYRERERYILKQIEISDEYGMFEDIPILV